MNVDPVLLFKSHPDLADLFDRLQNCVEQHLIRTGGGSLPSTPFRHQVTLFQRSEIAQVWMVLEGDLFTCFAIVLAMEKHSHGINPLDLIDEHFDSRRVPPRAY